MHVKFQSIRCFLLCFIVLYSLSSSSAFATTQEDPLVIVLDVSGSMRGPDANQSMIAFASLLADLHRNQEKPIGFIAFDEEIILSIKPTQITDFNVEHIKQQLSSIRYHRNTDVGLALEQANQMLNSGQILLLSDGETELLSSVIKRTDINNKEDQSTAIASLQKKQIPVHTLTLTTQQSQDMQETSQFARDTNGMSFFLDPSNPLMPQWLSAYAQTQNLLLSKVATLQSTQAYEISLPYIDYTESLDYILLSQKSLTNCQYNDASSARISINPMYTAITQASTTLDKQTIEIASDTQQSVDIFTLKSMSFLPILSYQEEKFHAKIIRPSTKQIISNTQPLPVEVSILKDNIIQETILLQPQENGEYTANYSLPYNQELSATISVTIQDDIFDGNTIELPLYLPELSANPTTLLTFEQQNIALDIEPYFSYSGSEELTYKIVDTSFQEEQLSLDQNQLNIEQPSVQKQGYIDIEAADPYGNTVINRIPMQIRLPATTYAMLIAIIIFIIAIILLLAFLLFKRKKKVYFHGMITGEFVHTTHGRSSPELIWLQSTLAGKRKITFQQLLQILNVREVIPEAKHIYFIAQSKDEILFWHNTNCNILLESKTVHRNQKFLLQYGNRLTIIFEDATTEFSLEYKPPTDVLSQRDGHRRLRVQMQRS